MCVCESHGDEQLGALSEVECGGVGVGQSEPACTVGREGGRGNYRIDHQLPHDKRDSLHREES